MRIITGLFKGKKLFTLEGVTTRPTTDFIREMIFSTLYDLDVDMANVLDLYAGCGSLGFEALSRGAEKVTFVEGSKKAVSTLIANINHLKCKDRCKIELKKVETHCLRLPVDEKYTLIFLDPPYDKGLVNTTLSLLFEVNKQSLHEDCVIVAEHSFGEPIDECFRRYVIKEKVNKPIVVTFLKYRLLKFKDIGCGTFI